MTKCYWCQTREALSQVLDILESIPDFDGANLYDDAIVELYTATQNVRDMFIDDCKLATQSPEFAAPETGAMEY